MVGSSTEMFTHSGADISNSATIQHCHRCHVLQEPWSQIVSLQVSNLDDFFRRHWLDKVRQGTPERQVLTLVLRESYFTMFSSQASESVAGEDTLFSKLLHVHRVVKGLSCVVALRNTLATSFVHVLERGQSK